MKPEYHRQIENVLKQIWRESGVRVDGIYASWINVGTAGEPDQLLENVTISAVTFNTGEQEPS